MARWRPRYPARTIRPTPCPSGLPRFTDRWRVLASLPFVGCDPGFTPTPCGRCGGWHATPRSTKETR